MITEALWKGSKTVRGASWNRLQPGQHFDQQRAVSCYGSPPAILVASRRLQINTSIQTVPKDRVKRRRLWAWRGVVKKISAAGAAQGSSAALCVRHRFQWLRLPRLRDLGGELLLHVPGGSQRLKAGLLRQARLPAGEDLVIFF